MIDVFFMNMILTDLILFKNILFETSYLYMSFLTNNLIIFYIIRRTSGTSVYISDACEPASYVYLLKVLLSLRRLICFISGVSVDFKKYVLPLYNLTQRAPS